MSYVFSIPLYITFIYTNKLLDAECKSYDETAESSVKALKPMEPCNKNSNNNANQQLQKKRGISPEFSTG